MPAKESVFGLTVRKLLLATLMVCSSLAVGAEEILPLSEVQRGMTGYGLTVFEGTKAERFDVEIVGVLKNIGPDQSLILARVSSEIIDRSGVIAGMSGSPIYIDDRLIGALAYAWQFASEPIAGITPIEQMLTIDGQGKGTSRSPVPSFTASELINAIAEPTVENLRPLFDRMISSRVGPAGALPISIPLSMSGFHEGTLESLGGALRSYGFLPVPSGSTGGGTSNLDNATLSPGDAFAAVLAEGDFSLAATGTVTHVDGDRVYGFGHPFLDMGEIDFPMSSAEIVTILPSMASSFKLSNTGGVIGTLTEDRIYGVAGHLGRVPDLIPVEFHIDTPRGSKSFELRIVRNSTLFPLILAFTADSIVANAVRAAGERTLTLESVIHIKDRGEVRIHDGWAGGQARQAVPLYLAVVSNYLLSNEFRDLPIERVEVRIKHDDELRTARLIEANVVMPEDGELNPGDTLRIEALLQPYRGESFRKELEIQIPLGFTPGKAYLIMGSGNLMTRLDFTLVPPDPRSLDQVVNVIESLRPATELAARLYEPLEGRVSGGIYHPGLPPSVQMIARDDTSNSSVLPVRYHSTGVGSVQLDSIVDGALRIELDIRPQS